MFDESALIQSFRNPLRELIPDGSQRQNKDLRMRLIAFCDYHDLTGQPWHQPDLAGWRDALFSKGRSPATVKAYLATVRSAYRQLLRDNRLRDILYSLTPMSAPPSDRKTFVDEALVRLQNAVHPDTALVKLTTIQDVADSKHLRLTARQAEQLLNAPDVTTIQGLRDAALIAVLLCTGIREDELCSLDVPDLRQSLGGELALRVRHGKGDKQRLIPYGELDWCLVLLDTWLDRADIKEGAVFRGLYKGGNLLRPGRFTVLSVQRILAAYPLVINGQTDIVRPHDCRRTYARLQYEAGAELVAIQQNLGHATLDSTLGYIGRLDADKRRACGVIHYDLKRVWSQ